MLVLMLMLILMLLLLSWELLLVFPTLGLLGFVVKLADARQRDSSDTHLPEGYSFDNPRETLISAEITDPKFAYTIELFWPWPDTSGFSLDTI